MADVNSRFHMGSFEVGADWQLYVPPISCRAVELTGDVPWEYCTDKDAPQTSRLVDRLQREKLFEYYVPFLQWPADMPVCWIRAFDGGSGTVWEKCLR